MPAWSDTLILKNGVSFSGTLTGANINSIMFKDRRGVLHRYSVYDVEAVQFGDAPKHSEVRPPEYDRSTYERPNDRNDGNTQSYGNNDNRGYDQTSYERIDERGNSNDQGYGKHDDGDHDQRRMERVILPAGTELALMTNQRIDSHEVVQGQTFSAQIAEDIRDTDGTITTFVVSGVQATETTAINDSGVIVGFDFTDGNHPASFERDQAGNLTALDVPFTNTYTRASGINLIGNVTGFYLDSAGVSHGWVKVP